jgi:hypothetical protein
MKEAGRQPWAVFHRHDPIQSLKQYVDDGETHIALAPHPNHERGPVIDWLRRCFAILPKSIHVHGLGLTVAMILRHFRFSSCDSASWLAITKYGAIPVPVYSNGRPDYSHHPNTISVTDRSSHRSNHFNNRDRFTREQAVQFLTEEVGVTLQQVRTSKSARLRAAVTFFEGLAARCQVDIYFVASPHDREISEAIRGQPYHLLSYELLRKRPTTLVDYVQQYAEDTK